MKELAFLNRKHPHALGQKTQKLPTPGTIQGHLSPRRGTARRGDREGGSIAMASQVEEELRKR